MKHVFSLVCGLAVLTSGTVFAEIQVPSTVTQAATQAATQVLNTLTNTATGQVTPNPTPSTGKRECRSPCYDTPNPTVKGCLKSACTAFDKANPGYFSGIDNACQLPNGTAITMASIESSCNPSAAGATGTYRGLFQFSKTSCPGGNLHDPNVQAKCMCDYTANTRRQYQAATGQLPSAGMYYLIHQQGGCGIKLATGGGARAVDVLSQCVSKSKCGRSGGCATSMNYAMRAISGNLPSGSGFNASTISASQFANIYLSKFSGIDNNDVCMGDGQPFAGGNDFASILAGTAAMNADGNPLSAAFLKMLMGTDDVSSILTPILNSLYDEEEEDEDSSETKDDKDDDKTSTVKISVVFNDDGTKDVTITVDTTKAGYHVAIGSKLWDCEGTYQLVENGTDKAVELEATKTCEVVAEGRLEDAKE